jgi:uncharacterized protein YraI
MSRYFRATAVIALTVVITLTSLVSLAAPVLAQSGNIVVVNTGAAHIRSGPAANTTALGSVPGGTELAVTGRSPDGAWWRVSSPYGVGWVSAILVVFRGTPDSVPVVSEPAGTIETPTVIVDSYPATVYRNPNFDSFVVGIAPTGSVMEVLGRSPDGNWWQVQTAIGIGWVNMAQVAFRGDEGLVQRVSDPGPSFDGPTVRVNSDTVVTTLPGGGDVIATLPAGTTLPTGGRSADNTWWQVADVWGIGWIPVSDVSLAGAAANIRVTSNAATPGPAFSGAALATAIVEAERKVAYQTDSFESNPMWDARLGDQLGVVARSTDGLWLQVTRGGYIGWMNFSGITLQGSMAGLPIVDTTPVIVNVAIVNIHRLNIRSGPGAQYASVTSVPGGSTLIVTGKHPTLPWLRVEGSYGVGWVRIMYIVFRGYWDLVPTVTEPVGGLEVPLAIFYLPQTVYSQPDLAYPAGEVAEGNYPIVGKTADGAWFMLQTPLGNTWFPGSKLAWFGDLTNVSVVQ